MPARGDLMNATHVQSDVAPDALTDAIVDNLVELFPAFMPMMPGAERVAVGESAAFLTNVPFPLFNGIVQPRVDEGSADAAIDMVVERARARQVPMLWWLTPGSRPADLPQRLEAHGFVRGDVVPGMAADLTKLPADPVPEDLVIERVRDVEALRAFAGMICDSFGMPRWLVEPCVDLCMTVGLEEDAPLVSYVGRIDGDVVTGSSVFYGAGVAGIYNVGTLAAYRGRGIGRAITAAPLLDARERGYRVGILHSSPVGFNVYRGLGFEQYCEIQHYVWLGDSPAQ
jgi:ribosomal protein S18 acetylase RimI-like enzyme